MHFIYVVLTPSTHGDCIAYMSLLGSYGVWTRFPSTFVVDMFSKHSVYVVLKKSKMWKCGVESSKTFMMWYTSPLIMEKWSMTSKNMGRLLWEKACTNISLVVRGQITSKLITINLVSDNFLSWFNIQNSFVIMLFILVHYVYVCIIIDGGCSKNAPFQPRHPSEHWIISWCVETLVCSWHKRS